MPLTTKNAPIAQSIVGTLPEQLPEPPANSPPELMQYHASLSAWYSSFLIAYKSQQQQLLAKLPTT